MAKQTGLGWTTLELDDAGGTARDIRNDCTNLDFATPREVQDVTGIDKSGMERLLLLADFSMTLNGIYNPAVNKSHYVLKTVATSDAQRTCTIVIGGATLANEVVASEYKLARDSSGAFTWDTKLDLADGTVPTWS